MLLAMFIFFDLRGVSVLSNAFIHAHMELAVLSESSGDLSVPWQGVESFFLLPSHFTHGQRPFLGLFAKEPSAQAMIPFCVELAFGECSFAPNVVFVFVAGIARTSSVRSHHVGTSRTRHGETELPGNGRLRHEDRGRGLHPSLVTP